MVVDIEVQSGFPGPPGHVHQFEACTPPAWGQQVLCEPYVRAGQRLMISTLLPVDTDHCVAEGCGIEARCAEHNLPLAHNFVRVLQWECTAPGGRFGRLEGGVFNPYVLDQNLVNWYEAPTVPGVCAIRAELDDWPQSFEDAPLADDPAAWTPASSITVWEFAIGAPVHVRPYHDQWWTFAAQILPVTDHLGRSMERVMQFRFTDVSREPGACLNVTDTAPDPAWTSTTAADNDLKIEPDQADWLILAMEGPGSTNYDFAETLEPRATSPALKAWCFDYGAWGRVDAFVRELPPGDPTEHAARRKAPGQPPLLDAYGAPWPVDEDGNHIWDGMAYGFADPDADNEADPMGLGTYGDGFSVYDEYRGRVAGSFFCETDPISKKDLFIYRDDLPGCPPGWLSISLFMQLGYGIQDCLTTNEVVSEGGLSVVCPFGGSHRGRNRYAITLLRGWHYLPPRKLGGTGPDGHWFVEQGIFCIVDVGNLADLPATPLMYEVGTAHELGHALALRPESGGGHCHTPSIGCIMDDASMEPATIYCDDWHYPDQPCIHMHSILMPQL